MVIVTPFSQWALQLHIVTVDIVTGNCFMVRRRCNLIEEAEAPSICLFKTDHRANDVCKQQDISVFYIRLLWRIGDALRALLQSNDAFVFTLIFLCVATCFLLSSLQRLHGNANAQSAIANVWMCRVAINWQPKAFHRSNIEHFACARCMYANPFYFSVSFAIFM